MSVNDYQQWLKMGQDLGMEGVELKAFVKERQDEQREDRAKEGEDKKARELLEEARSKRQTEEEKEKRQAEIEEARSKRQADDERDKRQAEDERIKRQMEIDEATARRQAEEEQSKRQIELELKKLETELKIKEIEARTTYDSRQNRDSNAMFVTDSVEGNGNNGKGMRDIKFPNFNENKDCLDAYLLRFERTVEAYEVPQKLWALKLASHLEGKALEVYQRLSSRDAKDYE